MKKLSQIRKRIFNQVLRLNLVFLFLIMFLSTVNLYAQTFDFTGASGNGTATATETESSVTMTVTIDQGATWVLADGGGLQGTVAELLAAGSSNINYTVTFSFSSARSITSLYYFEADNSTSGVTTWSFTVTNGTGTTVTQNAGDFDVNNAVTVSPPDWDSVSEFTVTATGTAGFQPGFDNIICAVPVPVELTSFNAIVVENAIQLNWETATEVNNYGFEIERAIKNEELEIRNWEKIGFVQGHGNSNSPKSYTFTDTLNLDLYPSLNPKYRLKQIDTDGTYEYYGLTAEVDGPITSVNDPSADGLPEEFHLSQNYPNPFNPTTTIHYSIPAMDANFASTTNVQLKIYDILGNEVATLVDKHQAPGRYKVKFNGNTLSSGFYIYKITAGNFNKSMKMLILK